MKIFLLISIVFTNGTTVVDRIQYDTYDQCYEKAMSIIHKIESQDHNVKELYLECVGVN